MIQKYEVNTSKLTFEITESTYVNNTEAVNQVIHNFQRQNIQISMDDFGSGYSSLNTLKDLRFLYYRPMSIEDFETIMHMQKAI